MNSKKMTVIKTLAGEFLKENDRAIRVEEDGCEIFMYFDKDKNDVVIGIQPGKEEEVSRWTDDKRSEVFTNLCLRATHAYCEQFDEKAVQGTLSTGEKFLVKNGEDSVDIKIFEDNTTLQ